MSGVQQREGVGEAMMRLNHAHDELESDLEENLLEAERRQDD